VFYDPVTSIEGEPYSGPVVGLSIPDHHNYVAGLGGCGISHNTYPLPEAQTDRFLLKLLLDYPSDDEERTIVDLYTEGGTVPPVQKVLGREEIQRAQSLVREVPIAEDIRDRAIRLVRSTREAEDVEFGASPRASMGLVLTAKARAFLRGRNHVSWEDVEAMAPPVLRHRILLDFRAEREGKTTDDVVADLLAGV
jgi:MoxR-like ATPase